MKYKILRQIEDFVNSCYMAMNIAAAEFAQENFPKLVNEVWKEDKTDAENFAAVKSMFELNKRLNNNGVGNGAAYKLIETFMDHWLNKIEIEA